ncbi:hypothetical protein [[Phormidium] sp. ETS-05]|uniref:hypothetical protein n=1 Tax=[Phormidium] sp. ETS-05 TaxID=222819 RepID=UPI001E4B1F71|nr:hypothetical protein [[Phormidium] sp. ETS-05]
MKRHGNLFRQIISFENLWLASHQAQKGKRFQENVLRFNYNLESEIFQLQAELKSKTYRPGGYKTFEIVEPKRRMISAAPYRDRVVHHALCHIIGRFLRGHLSSILMLTGWVLALTELCVVLLS